MKIPHRIQLCLALLVAPLGLIATPVTVFNDTQTAIFGSGNPNGGWVTSTNSDLGVTVGLRAKDRTTGATPNDGNGTFTFATAPAPRGLWNYEWLINTGETPLASANVTFFLSVDRDDSAGVSLYTINPLTYWFDNSYGTASTLNGQGVEGLFTTYGGTNTIAQNSQNITFGGLTPYPGGALALSPNASYRIEVFGVAAGQGPDAPRVVIAGINALVGNGGVAVPDSGSTFALLAVAIGGMVVLRQRFGQKHDLASAPA